MLDNQRFLLLAEYNQWMNSNIYQVCSNLSEYELKLDRKAFFSSIFLTLNHIMYGDLAFLSRFTGDPEEVPELGEELAPTFSTLKSRREMLDLRIIDWTKSLQSDWLAVTQTYQSKVDGKFRTVPRWVLVTHMFNHQTHHRGQVTTMLAQLGMDFGSTDIPFMPQFLVG
ncbi:MULTISPECIES: DinB family protein [unclassified Synechocystis]|uniref:DinB family protein n=1 Tax=unclassified Synechocystis TaxID=2640012 RepID=UPI0004051373|nr:MULTISPECIES: DinB family protein [unclassified Synechocystis]AIE74465.1 hypothetical protein D082_19370 [Synechocystis sp. PCC 6714]MCT0254772.1 DinB family protein [Synechocystis sp. CS-94]